MPEERLQKILAKAGLASRRNAEELIRQGKVTVDGKVVTEMGCKVDPSTQVIAFEGRTVSLEEEKIYLLLNKPRGYVTTLHDPQGRPIVSSLLTGITSRVFPVGRLDFDTEGALILTNDGDFAERILHPRFEIKRTYQAEVRGLPTPEKIRLLEEGVELEGKKTWPATVRIVAKTATTTTLEITIHEGRKRQVRLMCQAIGHRVFALKRIAYGGLRLDALPIGKYRRLTPADLAQIFS
ncbi:MAG: rRNA pseudouridine synthase [Deltaproteobacteria bacterium]|uniref:pseudouridine synthase n=1 Tax=Hydrosulfovibrio ferrireducens TaxID=2934181 RepID=UPI0011F680BB|nr:MAG: rRNA pseudouridine synthase [Deltaproteobacteria bacterium]